jgi:hypothetical protein
VDADHYEECTERHVEGGTIFKIAPICGVMVDSRSQKRSSR